MFGLLQRRQPYRRSPRRRRTRLYLEHLESRQLLAVYTPAQISNGYGLNYVPYDGTGQTIAVVIAYDNPTIAQDLQTFDRQFGLPDPNLTKATPQGQPAYNQGWALESALDVQWAHATAPGADILLVEARSNSLGDLFGAVDYARNYPGVSVVTMSWGSGEFSGETSYDGYFTTPSGHNGVTFVAASGDTGGQKSYPAISPNVVGVGGTRLNLDGAGNYLSETGWSGSGGGISSYEPLPDYQAGWHSYTRRTSPDVSLVADPNTGVYVRFRGGWYSVGGTSASAPQWAGLFALADQGLNLQGFDTLDGPGQALPALYGVASYNYSYDFNDITVGRAGSFSAGPGYDLVTGLGTPVAYNLVPDLINYVGGAGSAPGAAGNVRRPAQAVLTQGTDNQAKAPPVKTVARHAVVLDGSDPTLAAVLANARPAPVAVNPFAPAVVATPTAQAPPNPFIIPADFRAGTTPFFTPPVTGSGTDLETDDTDAAPLGPADAAAPGAPANGRPAPAALEAPAAPAPADAGNGAAPPAAAAPLLPCDAYFADEALPGLSGERETAVGVIEPLGAAPNYLAAAAGLALVVGGYWSDGWFAEPRAARKQRFPAARQG
jgi:hypothetical protein